MSKAVKAVMNVADDLLGMLRYLIRLFEKGVDEVVTFFKKIVDDFFDWLENMFKRGKADDVIKLKQAQKMWNDFKYSDFFKKPPKKPCFLAGTLIHTVNGLVPIEEIKTGTEVYCYDELKQKLTTQKVSETYKNRAEKYLVVTTQSGEKLSVTGQHLFYQKTSKTWIKANQLKVGMKLYNE